MMFKSHLNVKVKCKATFVEGYFGYSFPDALQIWLHEVHYLKSVYCIEKLIIYQRIMCVCFFPFINILIQLVV